MHAYFLLAACHLRLVGKIILLHYIFLWLFGILVFPVLETSKDEILGAVKY